MVAVAALALLLACGEPAQYRFGVNLTGLLFAPKSTTEGIYPDRSVLLDPDNPFALYGLHGPLDGGTPTKWLLLSGGSSGLDLGAVAGYYAWATTLAGEPTGENQFYTAQLLDHLSRTPGTLADAGSQPQVRQMAIAGYQRMLDAFPGAVTYDVTGTIAYPLATPAYQAIVALGGKVSGGWVLVTGADGQPVAVNPTGVPPFDGGT